MPSRLARSLSRREATTAKPPRLVEAMPDQVSSKPAIVRLVGARLLEQNDEWAVQRRTMGLETLAPLGDTQPVSLPTAS